MNIIKKGPIFVPNLIRLPIILSDLNKKLINL